MDRESGKNILDREDSISKGIKVVIEQR